MPTSETSLSLPRSLWIGTRGFTLLGIAGFLPWALGTGRWLGEGGMFALCAVVFVGLSGPLLHRLIAKSPHSIWRFQVLFTLAFIAYAAIWSAIWFLLRIQLSDYLGLVLGTLAFSGIVVWKFAAWNRFAIGFMGLAALHTLGYWLGDEGYILLRSKSELDLGVLTLGTAQCAFLAKLSWGMFYGIGFGAGLGWLFGVCQKQARQP